MICLLDTDTLVYVVRGLRIAAPKNDRQKERLQTAKRIVAHCRQRQEAGDIVALSAITVAELEYGARHSTDYSDEITAVRKVLTPFVAYDFAAAGCAGHYGEVRHRLDKAGAVIGAMDLLIAGHAKALGAILVTHNKRRFARVPGLKCENWAV